MKIKHHIVLLLTFIGLITAVEVKAQEHPSLILTKSGVEKIRKELGTVPLFDATLKNVQAEVDAEIELGIDTPIPKDFSGGYTHEKHKRNFLMMQKAGVLFQILQDEKYAVYVRDMLFQYEAMYKDLPVHPQTRSYARGKLFWQCLNDSNWLVYTSQAYDCIYDWLSKKERKKLEKNLFKPFADFISIENPQFFNRVHNHSTWGNAAVGMIALVMDDAELLERALYGLKDDGLPAGAKDNDGGLIREEGQQTGFLANIDEPFSPDGYYTEGPYYQRYAMYPFLVFAEALQNVKPELKIFEHKNGVLLKSVIALLNLTDADGKFFPLNDGQKGMSYYSRELVTAVDIAYYYGGLNPQLLSIATKQQSVLLDDSGLEVALAIRDGKAKPFQKKSINLTDGADGKQGGVGVLRSGNEDFTLVFKYAAQGLSHGHYDKLSYSFYEKGNEVIQDYGLARFVNIEQKGGGNYLKENKTWAKQSIAHNTVIQNETSHFSGKYEIGSKHHSDLNFKDFSKEGFQIISAKETNAYPGTELNRTLVMMNLKGSDKPIVVDLMKVVSNTQNQYDFPFYFMGQVVNTNFNYITENNLKPLGTKNGYQHLWLEAKGKSSEEINQFSFLNQEVFYTISTASQKNDELLFTKIGANDPEFNLRRDAGYMIRRNAKNTVFASVIEPHGSYSHVSEFSVDSKSHIENLKVVHDDENYTAVKITTVDKEQHLIIISNNRDKNSKEHTLIINDKEYNWKGSYHYSIIK
ncbi:alginate lyase family protein [Wenyingzhuangia sp. IMCC45467]